MYYYIMEPVGKKGFAWQEKVKNVLGDLGIAGETVSPSPARTIEELASLGITKGYSTIVAVGSEVVVDKVVTAILNQAQLGEVVLGIVPENYDSLMARKINVKNLTDACLALKHRKLQTIDVCMIEPNKYFITDAIIDTGRIKDAYLTTSYMKASFPFNKITIKPGLEVVIEEQPKKSSGFLGWFSKKDERDIFTSSFNAKKIKVETLEPGIPVKVDGEIIAKTPIVCQNKNQVLKIIVARDILPLKE